MASINLSAAVPEGTDSVHFIFGPEQFDVSRGTAFDTTDPDILANANNHPWLTVSYAAEQAAVVPVTPDPNDPHQTPTADHLSAVASPEAVQAAASALAEQQAAVAAPAAEATVEPTPQAPAQQAPQIPEQQTPADAAVAAAEAAND
jgi:hypothetical protein